MLSVVLGSRVSNARDVFARFLGRLIYGPPEKLLFEHIPKCGGTSVKAYLKFHYSNHKVFEIDGTDVRRSIDEFVSMSEGERHSFDLVLGHNAHELISYFHPNCRRLTILRNPVDRIISHYFYARQSVSHYLHKEIVNHGMSLADYVTSGLSPELRNNYVFRFTGVTADVAELTPEKAVSAVLDVLKKNYSLIGTLEDVDFCMQTVAEACNFHAVFRSQNRLNVTKTRPREVDPEVLKLIAEVNFLDMEVFRHIQLLVRLAKEAREMQRYTKQF